MADIKYSGINTLSSLVSQIKSKYLPLSGGKLTGALNGTTAEFSGSLTLKNGIELFHETPFIDFHFANNTSDYTSRIYERFQGVLSVNDVWIRKLEGKSWLQGATGSAAIYNYTSSTGLLPIIATNVSSVGSWVQSFYTNDSNYHLYFVSKSNIDAGTNEATCSYAFGTDGTLSANKFNGALNVPNAVSIYKDGEGGTIQLISKSGYKWEIDSHDDTNLRFFRWDGGLPQGFINFNKDGNIFSDAGTFLNTGNYTTYCATTSHTHDEIEKCWLRNYSVSSSNLKEVLNKNGTSLATGVYIIEGFITGTSHNVYHRWWVFINTTSGEYRAHELDKLDNGYLSITLGFHGGTTLLVGTNIGTQNYTVHLKVSKT